MKAINTYAASVVCYAAGVVKWTKKKQLECFNKMTSKQLILYKALRPKSDRKVGRRGLVSVEDLVRLEKRQLNRYTGNSEESSWKDQGRRGD